MANDKVKIPNSPVKPLSNAIDYRDGLMSYADTSDVATFSYLSVLDQFNYERLCAFYPDLMTLNCPAKVSTIVYAYAGSEYPEGKKEKLLFDAMLSRNVFLSFLSHALNRHFFDHEKDVWSHTKTCAVCCTTTSNIRYAAINGEPWDDSYIPLD